MSNETKVPGCSVYIGDEVLPSYIGIYAIIKIPKNQPVFHGKSPEFFFCRGLRCGCCESLGDIHRALPGG